MSAIVVRPGDSIILTNDLVSLTEDQILMVKERIKAQLPEIENVLILGKGWGVAGVYRSDDDS